ncbi:MAG: hypothetical protein E6Q33_05825 [Neisseriales bacterium]|nr:MAG: hypothetical protein E6Q33_05825 [Neisseriales bacterium]
MGSIMILRSIVMCRGGILRVVRVRGGSGMGGGSLFISFLGIGREGGEGKRRGGRLMEGESERSIYYYLFGIYKN